MNIRTQQEMKRYLIVDAAAHEFLLLSQSMAEMTAVAIWARVTSKHHSRDFCFVVWMAYDWAKFLNAMSKLTVISVWACSSLLPFVAEFSLCHTLVVHFKFQQFLLLKVVNNSSENDIDF